MMLTINELSKQTGLSSYEIRRRVHTGHCPHIRVGAKNSKILIDLEMFADYMREENIRNMQTSKDVLMPDDTADAYKNIGHENIRVIN
jgi:hypothetical protein